MANSWFVRGGGKVYGPLDSSKLKKLVAAGKIDQTTEISQDQNGPWVSAGKIKGLFVQPPIPATPAPAVIAATVPVANATLSAAPKPVMSPARPPALSRRGGYVEANLLPNEQLVYRGKIHWFYFFLPLLLLAFALFLCLLFLTMSDGDVGLAGLLFGLAGIVSGISRVITYVTSEFAVTNRRVILKQGFIRRKTMELMLGKVDSLAVDQGIIGRIAGFGTVRVSVATEKQSFPFLANPLEFRRQVQLQTPS